MLSGEKTGNGGTPMKVYAHRGFSGEYPENTMLAFRKARETGCDGIELDVQLSRDGIPVIMHDETLDRTTSGKGNLRDYSYEELCRFDCWGKFPGKYGFQKIPTLKEYLEWVKDTGLVTNIELKNSVFYYKWMEEKVLELVDRYRLRQKVLFSSFNHVSVLKCKRLAPEIPAGFLLETELDNIGWYAKENQVEFYHPGKKILSKEQVKECQRLGIRINVWTINKKKEIQKMIRWNVDGIITNYPDLAVKLQK